MFSSHPVKRRAGATLTRGFKNMFAKHWGGQNFRPPPQRTSIRVFPSEGTASVCASEHRVQGCQQAYSRIDKGDSTPLLLQYLFQLGLL